MATDEEKEAMWSQIRELRERLNDLDARTAGQGLMVAKQTGLHLVMLTYMIWGSTMAIVSSLSGKEGMIDAFEGSARAQRQKAYQGINTANSSEAVFKEIADFSTQCDVLASAIRKAAGV